MKAMSTAVQVIHTGAVVMNQPQRLTQQELKELIEKVKALRVLTKMTGAFTGRRIGALLGNLATEDLVLVSNALQLKPRELPRTHQQ
jgi:hypothetical protein